MTDVVRCPTVSALCVPAQAQFTSSQAAADCKGVHQYPASAPIPSVPSVPPPPPLLPPPAPRVAVADVKSDLKSELPLPIRSRRSAFKLSADEKWPWAGLPLSALKSRFPDKFIDTQHMQCLFCAKKGHTAACCPLSVSPIIQSPFFERLFAHPYQAPPAGMGLNDVKQHLLATADKLNGDNPFANESSITVWALRKRIGFWRAIGCPAGPLSWLAFGYRLRFLSTPPCVGFENHPGAFTYAKFVDEELQKRVTRGQFSIVPREFALQLHPLDVVPKASGSYRIILDCRLVNGFLPDIYFKLENLSVVSQVVKKGDRLFTTDLEDAYFHVPIHEDSRRHLCFEWRGVTYTTNVLPFGLNLAPWVFTKVVRPVVSFCRSIGISVIAYLDDFLWSSDRDSIGDLIPFVRWLLYNLGFAVSEKKSHWTPAEVVQFLGLLVNAELYEFGVPAERLAKVSKLVLDVTNRALRNKRVTARDIAKICGHILSLRLAVSPSRIYTRCLYADLNQATSWNAPIELSAGTLDELLFWRDCLPLFNGRSIIREASATLLFTDASDDGWGAHCDDVDAFGMFEPALCAPHTSSTYRELLAVLYALRTPCLSDRLSGNRVTFTLDSLASVYNLNKGGGPVEALSGLVKLIWIECLRLNIDATADWMSRVHNERADRLSRYIDHADWRLHPDVFRAIDSKWGPFTIDRFAGAANAQCKRFNSRYFDPAAEAVDAFRQDWSRDNNFVNPDFNDIDRVLAHARKCRAQITLVFPEWPAKPWFVSLRVLCSSSSSSSHSSHSPHSVSSDWMELPRAHTTFIPGPRSSIFAAGIADWRMFAVRLDFRHVT